MSEDELINKAKGVPGIYWLINDELKLCKFGSSHNLYKRIIQQKSKDFKGFTLYNIIKTPNYIDIERKIKKYANSTYLTYLEIIAFQDISEIEALFQKMLDESMLMSYSESNCYEIKKMELEIAKIQKCNLESELELIRLKNESIRLENERMLITGKIIKKEAQSQVNNNSFLNKLSHKKDSYIELNTLYNAYTDWYNQENTNCTEPLLSKKEFRKMTEEYLEKDPLFKYKKCKQYQINNIQITCFKGVYLG